MPLQAFVTQPMSHQFVEDAFQILEFLRREAVLVIASTIEKVGWGQLFWVANNDELLPARDGSNRVPDWNLRSFIKDDHVKNSV